MYIYKMKSMSQCLLHASGANIYLHDYWKEHNNYSFALKQELMKQKHQQVRQSFSRLLRPFRLILFRFTIIPLYLYPEPTLFNKTTAEGV